MAVFHLPEIEISSNARIKHYPTSAVLQVANASIFRASGWEPERRAYDVPPKGKAKDQSRSLASSRARAKAALRDICMCNSFTYFFTWTFSPEKIDRYDDEAIRRRLLDTLKNLVRRKGFAYVCVPERHADGAIHLHGLCIPGSVELLRATNAHTGLPLSTNRGQPVYNMTDWHMGFSQCIPLDENYERVISYITKYISKSDEKIFGKWYLASRNLQKKPEIELMAPVSFDAFVADNADVCIIPVFRDVRIGMKRLHIDGGGAQP